MTALRCFRLLLVASAALITATSFAQTPAELIAKGEVFDRKLQPAQALGFYLAAEKLATPDADLLLRIARQYRHLMRDTPEKKEKLRVGRLSLAYAERAAALAPNSAEAQLSSAISYGKMMPFMGSGEQVTASPRIKAAVDRTLRLDQNNDTAWHILGRWNRSLVEITVVKRALAGALYGSLPIGTSEAAEKALLKAIAINPTRLMHFIELGRIYAQMGRKDEARRMIQKGLSMPDVEIDDPELKGIGRATLKKVK